MQKNIFPMKLIRVLLPVAFVSFLAIGCGGDAASEKEGAASESSEVAPAPSADSPAVVTDSVPPVIDTTANSKPPVPNPR